MCMCTYFLFQRLYICVQLANVFTRNLFLSFSVGQLPMMTNEWKRESERANEQEKAKERREERKEKKRRGYTFCVILIERRRKKDCPFVPLTAKKKKTILKFIEINESHVLYVTKTTISISFRLLFQQ